MLESLANRTADHRSGFRRWLDDDPLPSDGGPERRARCAAWAMVLSFAAWLALWIAWRLV